MCGELSPTTKSSQIELRLDVLTFRVKCDSTFHTLVFPNFRDFQYFIFPKIIRYELRDSRNIQGFALI